MVKYDVRCALPTEGMMYFFADEEESKILYYDGPISNLRVFTKKVEKEERAAYPEDYDDGNEDMEHQMMNCRSLAFIELSRSGESDEFTAQLFSDNSCFHGKSTHITGNVKGEKWTSFFSNGGEVHTLLNNTYNAEFYLRWEDVLAGNYDNIKYEYSCH